MSKLVQNYLLQQPIGKGVYGQVFRAIHQKTKAEYAVKVIPKSSFKSNPKLQQLAINQINILSSLKNENIVRFIETLKTPNNFYFVYQFCNGGTLESQLQKKKMLKQNEALIIFRQLLDAFKQLNKNNIMHRDLKPDNIFLSDGKIKLGDFGFCKMLQVNMAQTMLGSPIYMAPQILKEEIYTLKADIWSLGVVLFEMLFGYCPFESSSISQLINVIKETDLKIPKQINQISDECENLIKKMLVKDQFKRIEWVDLFEYKIDDDGRIVSGYKKDLGIEALQKYFLFDIKTSPEIQFGDKKSYKLKDQVESDKIINYIPYQESIKIDSKDVMLKKTVSQRTQSTQRVQQTKRKEEVKSDKEQFKQNYLHSNYANISHKNEIGEQFLDRHSKWLRGIQLMEELSENGQAASQTIFYYLILTIIKEINDQYHCHPEWTDVLMEQKRCLSESLRMMNREQISMDPSISKDEIGKIWKKVDDKWKPTWSKAIRYIYGFQNNMNQIESILCL